MMGRLDKAIAVGTTEKEMSSSCTIQNSQNIDSNQAKEYDPVPVP